MRTLTGTLLALALVGSPALAQQHPWVPSGEPAYNQPVGAAAVQHPWVPSAYAGTAAPTHDASAQARAEVRSHSHQRPSVSGN